MATVSPLGVCRGGRGGYAAGRTSRTPRPLCGLSEEVPSRNRLNCGGAAAWPARDRGAGAAAWRGEGRERGGCRPNVQPLPPVHAFNPSPRPLLPMQPLPPRARRCRPGMC
jgi:hypothetical protein